MVAAPNNQYARKYDEKAIDNLCNELIEWARNSKDIHIYGFSNKKKKTPSWLNRISNDYPKFHKAIEDAKRILGSKIVNRAFNDKSVNGFVGMRYLSVYDKDYKDQVKWEAEIHKDSQTKENNKCIFNDTLKELKADGQP